MRDWKWGQAVPPPDVGSDTKSELKVKADSGSTESDPLRGLKTRFKTVFNWGID